jgi:ribonucleoside-diphosphate reductase alpha chain
MSEEAKARSAAELDEDMDDDFEDDDSSGSETPGHYQGQLMNAMSSVSIDSNGGVSVNSPQMMAMGGSRGKEEFSVRFAKAKMQGYDGDPCPECGAMTLVRNGSCLKCDSCGSTTGCS